MNISDSARWVKSGYTDTLESLESEHIGSLYPLIINAEFSAYNHVFVMRGYDEEKKTTVDVHYYIDECDVDAAKAFAERMVFKMHASNLQRDIDKLKVRLARTKARLEDTD